MGHEVEHSGHISPDSKGKYHIAQLTYGGIGEDPLYICLDYSNGCGYTGIGGAR